ncbi:MAG: polysaccharide deacetylase family protein [Candidatus Coproplasma sp.]
MNRKLTAFTAFMLIFAAILIHLCNMIPKDAFCFAFADDRDTAKCVYLTFDDGPSDRVTPKILDVLDEEGVKATFFIIGKNAETRQNLIEREYKAGHTVALHSYSHDYRSIYSSPEALLADIEKCNDVLEGITGERSRIYRFPGGSYNLSSSLVNAVCNAGYRYVDWNASVRDAEILHPTPAQLVNAAVSTTSDQNNVVLLCHDSTTKSTTAQALKSIIKYYKDNDYGFETF